MGRNFVSFQLLADEFSHVECFLCNSLQELMDSRTHVMSQQSVSIRSSYTRPLIKRARKLSISVRQSHAGNIDAALVDSYAGMLHGRKGSFDFVRFETSISALQTSLLCSCSHLLICHIFSGD